MITASYQLSNEWHGLGTVGHIVLAVLVAAAIVALVAAALRH